MNSVAVHYLDGAMDSGEVQSIRIDGQFITVMDDDGDQTVINGNAVKKVVVYAPKKHVVIEGELT